MKGVMQDVPRRAWHGITVLALSMLGATASAGAQVTVGARTAIQDGAQLTFGYLCDDRFIVRNDGTQPVDVEYAVTKGNEHTKLAVGAREVVELTSTSKQPLELWMDGKLIAKAEKDKRSCKGVQTPGGVTVRPLEVQDDRASSRSRYPYGSLYGYPYPYNDPFFYGYSPYWGFGLRSYYPSVIAYPVVVGGGRGGAGGGGRGGRR